jgi:hypothetical protein
VTDAKRIDHFDAVKAFLIVGNDNAPVCLGGGRYDHIKAAAGAPACFSFRRQLCPYKGRCFVKGEHTIGKKTLRPVFTDKPVIERGSLFASGFLQDSLLDFVSSMYFNFCQAARSFSLVKHTGHSLSRRVHRAATSQENDHDTTAANAADRRHTYMAQRRFCDADLGLRPNNAYTNPALILTIRKHTAKAKADPAGLKTQNQAHETKSIRNAIKSPPSVEGFLAFGSLEIANDLSDLLAVYPRLARQPAVVDPFDPFKRSELNRSRPQLIARLHQKFF